MMRRVTAVLAAALLAVAAGCMDYDETIDLNKDGSGTIEIRMAMDKEAYQDMRDLAEQFGEEQDDMLADLSESDIRARLEEGGSQAKLLRYEESEEGSDRVWEMAFSFEKPEDLAHVGMTGDGDASAFTFTPRADGKWVYARALGAGAGDVSLGEDDSGGMPEGMEDFDPESFDPEQMQEAMKALGEAMADMEEMMSEEDMEEMSRSMEALGTMGKHAERMEGEMEHRVFRFTVRFPGKVIESNATRVDGKTAVWEYKLADMDRLEGGFTAVIDR
ncbi:MAG: hypothetical protein JW958_13170 [Candidatus Eisenbacteria bacterium]|nr:hypothetical protein [Candidatus Eisenbacteria bacterium]